MLLMSIVVPFYIGLERYGKFIIIFALPATASVFLQSFYLENANRFGIDRVFSISLGLGFICTFIIFLTQCLHLEIINASLSALLFLIMHERAKWECISIFSNKEKFIKFLVKLDLLTLFVSGSLLLVFVILEIKSYAVPFIIVFTQMFGVYIFYRFTYDGQKNSPDWRMIFEIKFSQFKWALARTHEELFLTLMPMIFGILTSLSDASNYRISVSVLKLSFKAFPYRQDLLIAEFKSKTPSTRILVFQLIILFLLSVTTLMIIWYGYSYYSFLNIFHGVMYPVILSGCFVAFISIFGPLFNSWEIPLNLLSCISFAISVLALALFELQGFYITFVGAHVLLTIFMFWIIRKRSKRIVNQ